VAYFPCQRGHTHAAVPLLFCTLLFVVSEPSVTQTHQRCLNLINAVHVREGYH
jgi:hypothetical protein